MMKRVLGAMVVLIAVPWPSLALTPFSEGTNEIVVELQNLPASQACFGLRLELDVDGAPVQVVSDPAAWTQSTDFRSTTATTCPSSDSMPPSPDPPPPTSTFTTPASGSSGACDSFCIANGCTTIAGSGEISYYRTTFVLPAFADITADLKMGMDNAGRVFVNRHPVVTENDCLVENFGNGAPAHATIDAEGTVTLLAIFDIAEPPALPILSLLGVIVLICSLLKIGYPRAR